MFVKIHEILKNT